MRLPHTNVRTHPHVCTSFLVGCQVGFLAGWTEQVPLNKSSRAPLSALIFHVHNEEAHATLHASNSATEQCILPQDLAHEQSGFLVRL